MPGRLRLLNHLLCILSAHFIDENWSLQSYVLATRMFDGRHTAENVKEHLCTVVKE